MTILPGYEPNSRRITRNPAGYIRRKSYDFAVGSRVCRDPIGEDGGLNLYGYVGNDPVNAIDPLGLWFSWKSGDYTNWTNNFWRDWKNPEFQKKWNAAASCSDEYGFSGDRGDAILDDPDSQMLVVDIWNMTKKWSNLYFSFSGAHEYYGFTNSDGSTAGPYVSAGQFGGYTSDHPEPKGITAGMHSHWTNYPPENPSLDASTARDSNRPEYIITNTFIYRLSPNGIITPYPR